MADISTAVSMARVPILGEDGRISDDYIPESIPQAVTAAEQAATSAASSANQSLQQAAAAEKAASSATGSVEQAKTYANNASTYMVTAKSHAESAAADATAASQSASDAAASATAAEVSNKSAADSSADAMGFRNNAVQYRDQAREAAQEAQGYVSTVQQLSQNATNSATAAQNSATSAQANAEVATAAGSRASTKAEEAAVSAQTASQKADAVLDHYIESATATTLDPGSEATATVADKVLQLGIPMGDKGDPGTGVPEGGTPGQLLSKTDSGTAWVDPPSTGNVLTGEVTGYVAHADDAYTAKPREVRIKGKTWVNRWPVISQSLNGVTVATDGTGLITVSGTPTVATYLTNNQNFTVTSGARMSYLVSNVELFNASSRPYVQFFDADGTNLNAISLNTGNSLTVPDGASEARCYIAVYPNAQINASFRVMLVDGTEAPDCFTPPASITSVQAGELVTAGKNLLPPVSEWSASDSYVRYIENPFPIGTQLVGRYGGNPSGLSGNVRMEFREKLISGDSSDGYSSPITSWSDTGNVGRGVTVTARDRYICIVTTESASAYFGQMQVQLELGSTATAYEPPNITQTPLPEVELRSLPNGTCDELVIKADGTATVERRTQLVGGEVVALDTPTTEPQSPVSIPQLPAPTFNQYHDSQVPSDTTVTYERDVNIAFDNLAKQVAGTASAVAVREASTIEEE